MTPTPGVVSFGHKWNLEVPGLAGSEGDEGPAVVRDRAQTLRQLAHAMEVQRQRSVGGEYYSKSRITAKPSRQAPQNSFDTAPLRYPRLPTRLPSTSRSRAATRVAGSQPGQSSGQIQKCARIPRNRSLCSSRNAWSTVCLGSCTFHACAMTVYASNVK